LIKTFAEFFRRGAGIFFKEACEIRIVLEGQLIGDLRTAHGRIGEQAPGLQQDAIADQFARRLAQQVLAKGVEVVGRDVEQFGVLPGQTNGAVVFIDELLKVAQQHQFLGRHFAQLLAAAGSVGPNKELQQEQADHVEVLLFAFPGFCHHGLEEVHGLCLLGKGQLANRVVGAAAKKREALQVVAVLQKGAEQAFVEVHDIAIGEPLEVPAVHLSRAHKVDLEGHYRVADKVDGVRALAPGEQHQVVEGVAVGTVQVVVVLLQVDAKPLHQQVLSGTAFADGTDVVNRYGRSCHDLH
jgi:hypothetical protein